MIYYSLAQHPHEYMRSIDVRSSLPLPAAVPALRKAIASVDATLPVREIITVGEQVERTLSTDRTVAQLTAAFSVLGLALACIGLYGVLSYAIRQRTTEIGVRIALGASRADILRMVLREALVIVCAGAAVGIAIALGAGRVLTTMLFGLTPADPLTLATTTLILVAVAMLAAFLPARRAAASDPITALRCE
jgi:ABC-type antimicrobial peptide transport system permease subunit